MKLFAYSVFDNKANAFIPPFFLHNDSVAVRAFGNSVNDPEHQFFKNSGDYNLFRIGEFEDSTGVFTPLVTFENLGLAASYKE